MSTRPERQTIVSAQQSWDGPMNDNLEALFDTPFPPAEYADYTALAAVDPADYVNCLAVTEDTEEVWQSDGSAWLLIGRKHPNANGARYTEVMVVTVIDLDGQASPYSPATDVPAGHRLKYRAGRLIEAAAGTSLTSLDLGDGSDADRFANDLALTLGTTFGPAQATADPGGWSAAAQGLVITGNGLAGNFTAGQIRLVTVYERLTAPTS